MARQKITIGVLFGILQLALLQFYSNHSWFWTDEAFSAFNTFGISWGRYLLAQFDEGNVAPGFYLIEKSLIQLMQLRPGFFPDPVGTLRLVVALLPAATLSGWAIAEFSENFPGYFWKRFACAALFAGFNGTPAFFSYLWQARPYALWALATFGLMRALLAELEEERGPWPLLLWSLLLALVMPLAFVQIGMAGIALLALGRGPWTWRFRRIVYLFPAALLSLFYVLHVPHYGYRWPGPVGGLRMVLAHGKYWFLLPSLLLCAWQWRSLLARRYLFLLAGQLGIALLVLINLYGRSQPGAQVYFEISNRYFLFLLPACLAIFLAVCRSFAGKNISPRGGLIQLGILIPMLILGILRWQEGLAQFSESRAGMATGNLENLFRLAGRDRCFCAAELGKEGDIDFWGAYVFAFQYLNSAPCADYQGVNIRLVPGKRAGRLEPVSRYASISKTQFCTGPSL